MDEKALRRAICALVTIILFILVFRDVFSYPQGFEEEVAPDFEQTSFNLTSLGNGVRRIEATIRNNGSAPTTTGAVPSSWEKVYFIMTLSDGEGVLNESIIDLDLDGNGEKTNIFDVRWDPIPTRPMDVTVNGTHVYSLYEEEGFNFSINGISKYFQLGSITHALLYASRDLAEFWLDVIHKYIPNPTIYWHLSSWDFSTTEHVEVSDFQINGESVEVNLTHDTKQFHSDGSGADERWYVIPNQTMEIGVGEEVNLSCVLTADRTVLIDLWLIISWSPDNINRDWKNFSWEGLIAYPLVVNESTTTTTTSTDTSSTTTGTPSFSFLSEIVMVFLIAFSVHRKRTKKFNRKE